MNLLGHRFRKISYKELEKLAGDRLAYIAYQAQYYHCRKCSMIALKTNKRKIKYPDEFVISKVNPGYEHKGIFARRMISCKDFIIREVIK